MRVQESQVLKGKKDFVSAWEMVSCGSLGTDRQERTKVGKKQVLLINNLIEQNHKNDFKFLRPKRGWKENHGQSRHIDRIFA